MDFAINEHSSKKSESPATAVWHAAIRHLAGFALGFVLFSATAGRDAVAGDWPTYGHDNRRSCVTAERIVPALLKQAWTHTAPLPPRPAWPNPARFDRYNRDGKTLLKPRVIFDRAFHVAVVGDSVYFGSSADDSVYCINAATGDKRWSFCTEGPIRLAPTISGGKVYVGSDDGRVYCLRASDGSLVWRRRAAPRDYRVPNDGKLVSLWPVRTGVLVDGDTAYCGAGLFPSEGVYINALDAATGSRRWTKMRNDMSAQGYMLASPGKLYVPAGRGVPVAFSRSDGKRLGSFGGGGGAYALLTDDDPMLIYGPGRFTGALGAFNADSRDQFANFPGNHMVVAGNTAYLHTDTQLAALDRVCYRDQTNKKKALSGRQKNIERQLKRLGKNADTEEAKKLKADLAQTKTAIAKVNKALEGCTNWSRPCSHPHSLILAGDVLFAGGDNEVAAYSTTDGSVLWRSPVAGKALGLAVAGGRLFVSTDRGAIHCFRADTKAASKRTASR